MSSILDSTLSLKLRVSSFLRGIMHLSWDVDGISDEDYQKGSIYIERSESPIGPFQEIAGPIYKARYASDTTMPPDSPMRHLWYRLRFETAAGSVVSEPAAQDAETSLVAQEITRRFYVLLKEFTGRKVLLYPVRTMGERCPDCWSVARSRRTLESCTSCFGVGWRFGYLSPVQILLQIDPSPLAPTLLQNGTMVDRKTTARTLPYPPIKPNDILVEAENHRWRVVRTQTTQLLRANVRYELQLDLLPPGDVAYTLPVPLDPLTFEPSPEREFTRPTSISSAPQIGLLK